MVVPSDITCVVGIRGMGKSTFARHFSRTFPRVVIFDLLCEYDPGEGLLIEDPETLAQFFLDPHVPARYRIIYVSDYAEEEFPTICLMVAGMGNLCFLVEEVDAVAPAVGKGVPEFSRLIKRGRHRGISLIATTRRPAEVSRLYTSQTTRFVTFQVREPRDIVYLRSIMGDAALSLPDLPPFEARMLTPDRKVQCVQVTQKGWSVCSEIPLDKHISSEDNVPNVEEDLEASSHIIGFNANQKGG